MPSWNAGAKSTIRTGLGGPKLSLGAKRPSLPESADNVNENVNQDEADDRISKRQKIEHEPSTSVVENAPPAPISEKIDGVEEPRVELSKAAVPADIPESEKPIITAPPQEKLEEDDGGIVINVADETYESKPQNEQPVQDSSAVPSVTQETNQIKPEPLTQPDNVSKQVDPVELQSDSDSESDSETVPSLDDDDSEDSNSSNSSDDDEDSGSEDDSDDDSMAEEAESKPEGDALQIYSSSNPAENAIDLTTDSDPLTLASLSYDDLILQIRYFHVGKPLSAIDAATPVRCLTCTVQGHMAESCPSFKCSTCRSNEHMRYKCPSLKRCNKCRQAGHEEASCSSKLKIPLEQITCSLCENKGHFEDECETIWRTSLIKGYGSHIEVDAALNPVRLFCYECSSGGHLGNDCPTRRPRKPLGSSSWTTKGHYGGVLRRSILPPPKSSAPKTAPLPVASNSKQRVKAVPVSKATSIQIKGFANAEEDDDEYEPPPLIVTQHHHNSMPHAAGSTSFSVKGAAAKGAARPGHQNQKGAIRINIQDGKGGQGGKGKGKGR